MEEIASAANEVVRQSIPVLNAAAGELAKQANSLAKSKDPIGWLVGEEDDSDRDNEFCQGPAPPALLPVPLTSLHPWGSAWDEQREYLHQAASSTSAPRPGPAGAEQGEQAHEFPVDPALNCRVILWEGDLCALDVDAVLAPAAAGYAPGSSTVFERILRHGRRDLLHDVRSLEPCRSGEAHICKAYNLPCSWLLLTVGPKYKEKYHIAAQNTLNACYRECFQLHAEAKLGTLAVPCLWYHRGFPIEEQVHVALRSVRRCLEKVKSVECVVLVAASPSELDLYAQWLPAYFPRNAAEQATAVQALPGGSLGEWGEVAVEGRKILLTGHFDERQSKDEDVEDLLFGEDDRTFLQARGDADENALRRLEVLMIEAETPELAGHTCVRYLRHAKDLRAEPEGTRFVYRAPGNDRWGRKVLILLGARLPGLGARDARTLPLFVKEIELLAGQRFVLMYVHSDVSAFDTTSLEALQEMLEVVGARYRTTLDQVLVLHPSLTFRATFALGRAVSTLAASVWHDTVYLESLAEVAAYFDMGQLRLPDYVRASELA